MQLIVRKIPWYLSWKGLLFAESEPVIFKTRFGIHTFGLKHPIDVIILDKTHMVKALREQIQPNRFFFWHPFFDTVVELPAKTITKKHIFVNQKIDLQTF